MPVYTYTCPEGHSHEEFRKVDARDEDCACAHVAYRCRQCGAEKVGARATDKVCGAEVSEAKVRGGVATFEVTRCGGRLERSPPCPERAVRTGIEAEQARMNAGAWSGRVKEWQSRDPVSGWEQNYRVVKPGAGTVPGGN